MQIELFRTDAPPNAQRYSDVLEAGMVRGNMGGLVIIRLGAGLELDVHQHEQEHVGVVLSGEFTFFDDDGEVLLRAGDLYRILPHQPHGVRCPGAALIAQARA